MKGYLKQGTGWGKRAKDNLLKDTSPHYYMKFIKCTINDFFFLNLFCREWGESSISIELKMEKQLTEPQYFKYIQNIHKEFPGVCIQSAIRDHNKGLPLYYIVLLISR